MTITHAADSTGVAVADLTEVRVARARPHRRRVGRAPPPPARPRATAG